MNNAEMLSFKMNALRRSKGHSDTRLEAATTHFLKMVIRSTINEITIRNGKDLVALLVKKVKVYWSNMAVNM